MIDRLARGAIVLLKRIMGRGRYEHIAADFDAVSSWPIVLLSDGHGFMNEREFSNAVVIEQSEVFPKDNTFSSTIINAAVFRPRRSPEHSKEPLPEASDYFSLLNDFVERARIAPGWRYDGLYYAGFSLRDERYILPSWLWINGVVARHFADMGQRPKALELADRLLGLQLPCGGWVARYDYSDARRGVSPIIAPNDSAHCADNGLLTAYRLTGETMYLSGAERCAQWIMAEGVRDGLVSLGFDLSANRWLDSVNIIDTGFTAGLFCSLYDITEERQYLDFAGRFIERYIQAFYRGRGVYSTVLASGHPHGKGIFARGLAWALEGMLPYVELTGDPQVAEVVDETVTFLLERQERAGAWRYNLRGGPVGRFSGADNKGTPVIAAALARWGAYRSGRRPEIDSAVVTATDWCIQNMETRGVGAGGIFAENLEGAVVHSPNSQVAFTYSNCYLARLMKTES